MPENRISASLTPEDKQAVMAAIATLREKFSPEERRSLPKMGDKSRAFVQKALELAQQSGRISKRQQLPVKLLYRKVASY